MKSLCMKFRHCELVSSATFLDICCTNIEDTGGQSVKKDERGESGDVLSSQFLPIFPYIFLSFFLHVYIDIL